MTAHVFHLSTEDIDCSPGWVVRRQDPDAGYLSVISRFGVVQPVLVTQRDSVWLLVCGWRRVRACRKLSLPVPCLLVAADDLTCAEISLHCNAEELRSGPRALTWARHVFTRLPPKEAEEFCASSLQPLLGNKGWRILHAWLGLDAEWDELIAQGKVPFELGPSLAALPSGEPRDLLPLFTRLAWSLNKARQVSTWLNELAQRDGRAVRDILGELGLMDILNRKLSPKDAQQSVVRRVHAARFPVLDRLEREFDRLQGAVVGRTRWRIQPEQHFETNGLTLLTRIRSQADAEQVLAELGSIVKSRELSRIWSWQERALDGKDEKNE